MSTPVINKRLKIIEDLQQELNKVKNLYNEFLEDDNTYQEIAEEDTKIKAQLKEKKNKILLQSKFKDIDDQIKKIRQDIKENKELLSQEIVEYYRESGEMQIETEDGDTKKIVFSVKLVNN